MKSVTLYSLLIICFYLSSCVKDIPNPDTKNQINTLHHSVLILNEGAYGNNNSELSYIDLETQQISQQLFYSSNGKSLGDVAQSMNYHQGKFYIALNNSNKIMIIDALSFKEISQIKNIPTPRYMCFVQDSLLYISSMYKSLITVVNINNNQVVSHIQLDFPNTEHILFTDNYLWVCNWDIHCNYLYKINPNTNQIEAKVNIAGYAPHGIVQDAEGLLWILSGNKYKNTASFLTCIDPTQSTILKSFSFPTSAEPIKLAINPTRDSLFYIGVNYDGNSTFNGLYTMSIYDTTLPSNAFIQAPSNSYFWAFGIDASTHHIFVSDPKGFTQKSTVTEYSGQGEKLNEFQAGIGANYFYFYP